jgi:hypothetical protein
MKSLEWTSARFVNLETYRRSGVAVRTPLWFVAQEGNLYMRTSVDSAKVKRLRHTPQVRVAPCDGRGRVLGTWQTGQAQLMEPQALPWLQPLIVKKYGWLKRLMDWRSQLLRARFVVIAVQLHE